MNFDLDIFSRWIMDLAPEYVWLGFNSRPKSVILPEPSVEKMEDFIAELKSDGIEVRGKDLRGIAS